MHVVKTHTITCLTKRVSNMYVARCAAYPAATAVGETEDEACDNLAEAVEEYIKRYPDKAAEILETNVREVRIAG